jgi:HEAT repeat protein
MTRIVIDLAILTALANLVLLGAVMLLRAHRSLRVRRHEQLRRCWLPVLARAAGGALPPDSALPPLANRDLLPWLREFDAMHDCVKGSGAAGLNALASRLDISSRLKPLLSTRSVQRRIIAVIAVGNLRDATARDAVERELWSENLLLSLLALRSLIRIDGTRALPVVRRALAERQSLSPEQVSLYLADIGARELAAPLEAEVLRAPAESVARLVPLLRAIDRAPAQRFLTRLLAESDDERTIAECLRLIDDRRALDSVRRNLAHARWHVRMLATAALGRIGDASDAPRLEGLLRDSSWWVRDRAAKARIALATRMRETLDDLMSRIEDRYGRDALTQAIAERGG